MTVTAEALDRLAELLVPYRGQNVFNEYAEVDETLDRPDGAVRRLTNLRHYLTEFRHARYVLISEAPGYAGCRFSGVSFTDERFLVGPEALPWARTSGPYQRSSRDDRSMRREMSATIVWGALGDRRDIVFWPAFPWHPQGNRGPLSNRTPRRSEFQVGHEVLRFVLEQLFPGRTTLGVGRHGEAALQALGYPSHGYIRHPAQGGATEFRRGIAALPRLD